MCFWMLDEISLKKSIDYDAAQDKILGISQKKNSTELDFESGALVLLVSGLKTYWRQAFAYFFVKSAMHSNSLFSVIIQAIEKLAEIGLEVIVISSDQGSNFTGLLSLMKVSKEQEQTLFNDLRQGLCKGSKGTMKYLFNKLILKARGSKRVPLHSEIILCKGRGWSKDRSSHLFCTMISN